MSASGPWACRTEAGSAPSGRSYGERVCTVLCEEPEGAFGGDAAGQVGVGGDDRSGAQRGELAGLLVGEGGSRAGRRRRTGRRRRG